MEVAETTMLTWTWTIKLDRIGYERRDLGSSVVKEMTRKTQESRLKCFERVSKDDE